jgi:lipopolysaccharide/colanic/teichoic acid biosynthesis glycosyltransferase
VLLSGLLLILMSPLMVGLALAVRLTSPGAVLFKQPRLGIGGQRISVWKFRTMHAAPAEVAKQASPGDNRITPVGRWLRRWSLDELPQLFNVLEGSMPLMGPRPHPLWLNDKFSQVVHAYMQRHRVKPGITGWAQDNGYRGETATPERMSERVKYDLYYITHWSPWLDVCILARTLSAVVRGDNAY